MKLWSPGRLGSMTALCTLLLQPSGAAAAQAPDNPPSEQHRYSPDHWPSIPKPPAGAPNVLLIMTDDVGFASTSTFGGPVPTPTLDVLARDGARYNRFNTTAMCSPTRAALLTGRNPHKVEMGNINNLATGYEGYTSVIPKSAGMVAETLRQQGYATAAFGKWHIAPPWELSAFGPFDRWPTGIGFNYFYGFHGGDTDQFAPALFENTVAITPPENDPDYILDRDLADRTIRWIQQQRAAAPDHPFFVYLAPGTAHTPHSVPKEWLEKFKGKFDGGWDAMREEIFKRQKALGTIPKDARLTPRPDFLPAWDSIPAERKQVYARMMEAFAAALAFNDHEVGRIIDSLKASGQLDNTLVVFIQGDNGASAEGGLQGLMAEESMVNGYEENFDYIRKSIDEIGGPRAHNHFPAMWAWALNTPFQYYKQVGSHFGGTRNGLVVSWRGKIKSPGSIRQQFLYVTDVVPTILDAARIKQPSVLNGVEQMPFDGISFADSFADPKAPSKRHTQAFEIMQNAAIYHNGWWAGTKPAAAPWDVMTTSMDVPLNVRKWELYNVEKDFSQSRNLADTNPAKLEELKALFLSEAGRGKILPVHGIGDGVAGKPSLVQGRTSFAYSSGVTRIPENTAPRLIARSYEITADIVVPPEGANGVLVAHGGRFGGYSLYLKDGRPTFHYNMINDLQYQVQATDPISPGAHQLMARFAIDKPVRGSAGTLTLLLDGKPIAKGRIEHTHRVQISSSEGFDVGEDTLTPVSDDYTMVGGKFSGELKQLRVELK